MQVFIDIMETEDLDSVMEIENSSFTNPWSKETFWQELIHNPHSFYLIASTNGRIVGYIGSWLVDNRLHITNLAIDKRYRNKGIATKLLGKVLSLASLKGITICTLEVRISNYRAVRLYEKLGFEIDSISENYYKDNNEDALRMWKELENEGQR